MDSRLRGNDEPLTNLPNSVLEIMIRKVKILYLAGTLVCLTGVLPLLAQREPPPSSDASVVDRKTFEGASAELLESKRKKPEIEEAPPVVSQPGAFAPENAQTVVAPQTTVTVEEGPGKRMGVMQHGATLKDLVAGLNALGVAPRDLITILQAIKAAGALQADIEVM